MGGVPVPRARVSTNWLMYNQHWKMFSAALFSSLLCNLLCSPNLYQVSHSTASDAEVENLKLLLCFTELTGDKVQWLGVA
jgi:hypothetical protein